MPGLPSTQECTTTSFIASMGVASQTMAANPCGLCWTLSYFVVVDAHSKWPEVFEMPSTSSARTIYALHHLFATYDIPEQVVSDNRLQFISDDFTTFLKKNGV